MPAPIGADDLYRFRWIDHVRLSADGERVAYQLSWADSDSRQNRSRIVVRRLLDAEPVDATAGPRRDHSPEWSPDGRRIAFVSRRGAADQVFVLDLAGTGEAVQLSSITDGASSPAWSSDGKYIAFIGMVVSDPDAIVDDPRPPDSREQVRRAPVARIARRLDYKHDGQGFVDGRYHHLFVVPATGGEARQLTFGAWDVTGFDWAPDAGKLVVSGNAEPGADLQRALNLYVVDLSGSRVKLAGGFYLSEPVWSPRGDFIAFVAPNGLDAGLLERLWIVPSGGGDQRCVTIGLDQAIGDSVISDMRVGHDARLVWSADGERVYFLSSGPGVTGLYSCDLEGNVRPEIGGQRHIFDFDVTSGVVAFCAADTSSPGELHMFTHAAEARLTDLNPWLKERYIAEPERQSFTAPDGWVVEGWAMRPQGFDIEHRYPLVMEVHGGPHGQYGWSFFHEFQILAGMGYIVLTVNPRGSDGYGEHFSRQVVRDWGGKDYIDLMSSLDQFIESSRAVDTTRMGIGGGSYGGYMTNWVIGQTERFAAAVAMRSISNLVSEYAQHDIVLWGALELGPPPWPDLDELWKRSPLRYVQNIQTPLLLSCGEMDLRCAISQSEEMFGAMRFLGKTVEMVRFPEESHDLSRNGRPDRRVERLRRVAAWYERFLGTAPVEQSAAAADTQVLAVTHVERAESEAATTTLLQTVRMAEVPVLESPNAEALPVQEVLPAEEAIEPAAGFPTAMLETLPGDQDDAIAPEAAAESAPGPEAVEPEELLPVFPEPEAELAPEPEAALAPEPEAALAPEPEAALAPEPVSALPEEPEPEVETAEPVVAEQPAAETVPTVRELATMDVETAAVGEEPESPTLEPEPAAEMAEPVVAEQPEPVAQEPEPAAPEPGTWGAASAAEPPAPQPEPAAAGLASTMIQWPTGPMSGQDNGSQGDSGEGPTSIIPAWQPTEPSSETRRTVSLQAMPPEAVAAGEAYAARLTFESGPFAGRIVALPNQMVTFGRAPDNDVVVGDPATSGRHGRLELRAGAFWISDLGSTNGTLVNGEPVIEKQLNDGDLIAIGQNTIRFTLE